MSSNRVAVIAHQYLFSKHRVSEAVCNIHMSTSCAQVPVTLIFQKMYVRDTIGEPSQRLRASIVLRKSLLSIGACNIKPMRGRIQVVMVADA